MALPIIATIAPTHGPIAGGTTITIVGFHFTGTTDVLFDGLSTSFAVVDDNTISATTPGSPSSGPQVVEVVNADGSSQDPFPPTMADSSGNGNTALYNPYGLDDNITLEIAGLVTGNDAARIAGGPVGGNAPVAPSFGTGDVFMCGWMQTNGPLSVFDGPTIAQVEGTVSGGFFNVFIAADFFGNGNFLVTRSTDAGTEQVSVASIPLDTDPHFVAATYEDATETYTAYLDGVPVGTASTTLFGSTGVAFDYVDYIGLGATANFWIFDEIAFGATLLSSGDVSDLYDARGDFSTYNSLMLSFNPVGYYHLDETHGVSGFFTYDPASLGWYINKYGMAG